MQFVSPSLHKVMWAFPKSPAGVKQLTCKQDVSGKLEGQFS